MLIEPNTNIYILKNVPLDNTYDNSIFFSSKTAQRDYFITKRKYTFDKQSYQRVNRGYMRVQMNAENLYDCNYLMFQNASFGEKWFYAFITSVNYVNNVVSEITYELDVIQTWFFDFTVGKCFVEREHSASDVIGDNLVPENLEFGDYLYRYEENTSIKDIGGGDSKIVFATTVDIDDDDVNIPVEGDIYSNIYSGVKFKVFDNASQANNFISKLTDENKANAIVSVFMYPNALYSSASIHRPSEATTPAFKRYSDIDGYVPRNKKLFTAPYNMLYVTDNDGCHANFAYEFFNDPNNPNACVFKYRGALMANPQMILYPMNYKGVEENYNEKMVVGNFPQCCFNIDSFKAWLAQGRNQRTYGFFSSGASMGLGLSMLAVGMSMKGEAGAITKKKEAAKLAATGGAMISSGVSKAVGAVDNIFSKIAEVKDHATLPPQSSGLSSGDINFAIDRKGFDFYNVHIRREFAEIIDGYFDLYGYATHRLKVPNIYMSGTHKRPHWNYIKTSEANIVGSLPVDDMTSVKNIFDNGIRFWFNGDEIGAYGLNNA